MLADGNRIVGRRAGRNRAINSCWTAGRAGELGQQGLGALAGLAQVAAHADDAGEGDIDGRAGVETVRGERTFGMALGAVAQYGWMCCKILRDKPAARGVSD